MKGSLSISNFLEEISSLSHYVVFFYFFALITVEGFLISPCYSLELCIQMGVSSLFSFVFSFFFSQLLSSNGKESICNTGDLSLIPGLGRHPGKENDNPLQYFYLENPTDKGAWQTTVHGSQRVGDNWETNTFIRESKSKKQFPTWSQNWLFLWTKPTYSLK